MNPYLNFPGNTEQAFLFYKSVIGGEFSAFQRFNETPEGDKLPAYDQEKIMHIALPIGEHGVLMATDALESMGQKLVEGNNFSISLQPNSQEEADHLFNGLSAGGLVTMPMQHVFWGDYFGMLTDKFGIQWMITFTPNPN